VLNLFPARQFGVSTQTESIAENTGLDEANEYSSHRSLDLGHIAVSAPGAPPLEPPPQPSPLILQRRLNIVQSGDKYEVENGYSSHSSLNLAHIAVSAPGAPPLEPPPQPSPLILQRRLNIGQSGDKYEVEADKGASQVVNLINSPLFRNIQSQKISSPRELEPESQTSIQRQSTGLNPFNISVYEPGTTPPPPIQTVQAKGDNIKAASGNIEDTIKSKKGSGEELADNVREPMETAFDANFSRVKVHTDGESDQLNKSLNSRAFATGQDIFFSQGAYNPGSRDGQELLAHELTHIVQQNSHIGLDKKVNRQFQDVSQAKTINKSPQAGIYIQRNTKVSGTKSVSPDVAVKILENMSKGEPPFRPDKSLGGCEWMTTEGNPYTGIGGDKSVTLPVEATRPKNPLIFREADLVEIYEKKLNQISNEVAEAEFRREAKISNDLKLSSQQRKNAHGKFKNRMAERQMWEEVGNRVRSNQSQVGEVILENSIFSKQGNGKFLVVADRTKVNVKGGMSTVVKALENSAIKAEPIVIQAAKKLISQRNLGRVQGVFKYGGRILIIVALAGEAYKIYHAENKVKAVVESTGGWVGASAGAAAFAAWFAPVDVVGPWAWAIHGVGTLIAGGVGYWIGSETTRTIYELVLEK
jgi:hypothetical protein